MYKTMIENLRGNESLDLSRKNVGDEDIKSLAEALKNTQITQLNLSNNNISCNGLKQLADVLKNTQIKDLNLAHNKLQDEGVEYLAEILSQTESIKVLNLEGNKISFEAAEYLNGLTRCTNIESLYLDVYHSTEDDSECILQRSHQYKLIEIGINDSRIGKAGSRYLNRSFSKTGIYKVTLNISCCNEDDVHNLAQAFKNITINRLRLTPYQLTQFFSVGYLVRIFKKCKINKLIVNNIRSLLDVECLVDFLKNIRILDLESHCNDLSDEDVKILAQVIKSSDIMHLSLNKNSKISPKGVRYLSEILRESKILKIDLIYCNIGIDGAKHLANGLLHSQVTDINLRGNRIGSEGYQALIDVVNDTNIECMNFTENGIKERIYESQKLTLGRRLQKVFEKLVSFNSNADKFEFIVLRSNDIYGVIDRMDITSYAFLIGTLINNPNSKVHVIYKKCANSLGNYNYALHEKIEEFIGSIKNKFISFIERNLPELLIKFPDADYVDLVRQFEESKLHDIVQNLLLHRILYYVDENREILHPYIYKLLNRYNLPMYKSELEPNKKNDIISYFESHPEIKGVHEILDLLKSNSI